MIVQASLAGVLLALALFSRRVRAFAIVLLFSTAASWGAEMAQIHLTPPSDDPLLFFKIPSYADAFVFSAIAILMIGEPFARWRAFIFGLSVATVAYDAYFWYGYYLGVSGDPYYVPILLGLFLISVAVLVFVGGNDVYERVGSFLASFRNVFVRFAGPVWARVVHRKAMLEERA